MDILRMNDAGASYYTDFTLLGYPSTYMVPEEELLNIFDVLDFQTLPRDNALALS